MLKKEEKTIQRYQWTVAIASGLLIVFLITALILSGPALEWKKLQRDYLIYTEALDTGDGMSTPHFITKGIQQFESSGLNRIDRCVTCHLGIEDPRMKDAPQPFTSHPVGFFDNHPPDQYGCTVCHGGQGRALNSNEAHGIELDTHWDHPLLSDPYIQSSCGRCHLAIFSENTDFSHTDVFRQGQEIFNREGCLGCHKARGVGGIIGPDLTEQGEKTRHEYSFKNIDAEQTISNWLKEHFKDPEMVSPGSQMLKIDLPEQELDALTTFVLGLAKPDIAFEYFSMETLNEFKGNRQSMEGERTFSMACSGCHGKEGTGKSYEEYDMGTPAVLGKDFQRVVSDDFIVFTLLKGRSQREMASWMSDISGLREVEISGLARMVRPDRTAGKTVYDDAAFQRAEVAEGEKLFARYCATCHGTEGSGGIALRLNQADLLAHTDNSFLLYTLQTGRAEAVMPDWQNLSVQELYALVKYMRSWHSYITINERFIVNEADAEKGKLNFRFMCSRCHGEQGKGQTGPAIINEDFLSVATDDLLYRTIAFGRSHTAMFGWSTDVYNAERLTNQDIGNLLAYMREEASKSPDYIYAGRNPGDRERGEPLYRLHCAECHGEYGEGDQAPALNNQELLSAASNGYFLATISVGRKGTEMPEWGWPEEDRPALTADERHDIVAWIRGWQRISIGF
ncbi:MAG: c-type cytochrome [Bacteroidales bacterium]|nr:c-type cytochrome [Bacteroidales bacterium]